MHTDKDWAGRLKGIRGDDLGKYFLHCFINSVTYNQKKTPTSKKEKKKECYEFSYFLPVVVKLKIKLI